MKERNVLQVTNFPVDLRRKIKVAAAVGGQDMREFIIDAVEEKLLNLDKPSNSKIISMEKEVMQELYEDVKTRLKKRMFSEELSQEDKL